MTRLGKCGLVALSIAVAILVMGLWLRNFAVSAEEFAQLVARLRYWPILPLFVLLAGHVALSSWRWSLIEASLGAKQPSFRSAFTTSTFALGLGTFLPSPLINVICRSLANRFSGASGLRGALSGGIDQIADLAMVVLVAIPAVIAFLRNDLALYLWGVSSALLLGLGLILVLPKILASMFPCFAFPGLGRIEWLVDRPLLFKLYGISLLRVANLTLMTLAIHAATGAGTVPAIIIGVPLVTLAISATMLPGAFGVSEWSFSAVFSSFGVSRGDIVLFVLANRTMLTGLSLMLALLVLLAMALGLLSRDKTTYP